jgi:lysyl-tRNA synthetase class 2
MLARIRSFFAERGVLEVETPLLAREAATDLHLHSIGATLDAPGVETGKLYLQTSPEFAMKRLLAAGSGPIFQVCKAFRDGEAGPLHNPEFTLLEWYRPSFDHHRLMDEMDELLSEVLGTPPAVRVTYRELFEEHLGIDPLRADAPALRAVARDAGLDFVGAEPEDVDGWLHLLLAAVLEPRLGRGRPTFLLDFPASQAALARLRPGDPPVAERFEVYVEGIELANGFHELADPEEQRRRFTEDLARRRSAGLPTLPVPESLLAALEAGFPACAGVALGIDRLLLARTGGRSLTEVLAFPVDRA